MRTRGVGQRVVMLKRGWLGGLRRPHEFRLTIWTSSLSSRHGLSAEALTSVVLRVIEQSTDVVHEERIQTFGDLFFVRKVQSTLEWDPEDESVGVRILYACSSALPDTLQVHWPDLDDVAGLFALEDSISPASGHASDVKQLGAVDEVVI